MGILPPAALVLLLSCYLSGVTEYDRGKSLARTVQSCAEASRS